MAAEKRKLLILSVLDILKKHTDADHRLRQQQIIDCLLQNYGLHVTRKSLRAELADLQEAGYPVVFHKGWYYEHEFSRDELDLVIDSVLCSARLTDEQRAALLGKLAALGGEWYEPPTALREEKAADTELLDTLHMLQTAIREGQMVSFRCGSYDVDKKLHPVPDSATGKPKQYRVSPCSVETAGGRYYLIGCPEDSDEAVPFRVDRILAVRMLKRESRPADTMKDGGRAALPEAAGEPNRAYSGKARKQRIEIRRSAIDSVLDWFGMSTVFEKPAGDTVVAVVTADPASVEGWLKRFGDGARLL